MTSIGATQKELLTCLLEIAKEMITVIAGVCNRDEEAMDTFEQLSRKEHNIIDAFCKISKVVLKLMPLWQDIDDPSSGSVNKITDVEIAIMKSYLAEQGQHP